MSVMEPLREQFKNKKVLIVGLGLQGGGVGLVKFFAQLGARLKVTDLKRAEELKDSLKKIKKYDIDLTLGQHLLEDFLWADIIFKGPSVPWDLPHLQKAVARGTPVEMEASFFASHCPCPIIGVTGTRGKSTTSSMINEVMKKAGFSVSLAGNMAGTSTVALLEKVTAGDYVILELSSWQLSGFHRKKISPHISVFTNLYPDHLNFYANMNDYFNDKKAIYQYQKTGDSLVAHKSLVNRIQPALNRQTIFTSGDEFKGKLQYLKGDHNYDNAALAYQVGRVLKIEENKILNVITDFKPLPYRLDKIATIRSADIYNDSTSTTPIACQKAISAFEGRGIILILGGNSKQLPVGELAVTINESVKKVVLLIGSFTDEIQILINKPKIVDETAYDDLQQAFDKAVSVSQPSDVILFSPAATSFAMFTNEFDRGEMFDKVVREYEAKKT